MVYFHLTEWADEPGRKKLDAQLMAVAEAFEPELHDPDAPPWWWDDSGNDSALAGLGALGVVRS